jgi:predicted DNA-binding transcriptional regulator AlpA
VKRDHITELAGLIERILSEREAAHVPAAPALLTARDVAHCLQTNTQAVYRLAREGKLPAVKLNPRTLRWTEDAVSAFINGDGIIESSGNSSRTLRVLRPTG